MKGMIIYGNPLWGDNERATYCEYINDASFEVTQYAPKEIISCLKGETSEMSKAICSEDDEYDFEIGALIALMKMCGVEKVVRACNEAFPKERYNTYVAKLDGELNELKKENKSLKKAICAKGVLNGKLFKDYNTAKSAYEAMVEKSTGLMDEVKELKEENEKLKKENYLWENSDKSLRREVKIVRDALNMWKHKYQELRAKNNDLECENYKLKTDCEKLKHGYIDNNCDGDDLHTSYEPQKLTWEDVERISGRQNGKQYSFLIELFKKLPKDKVEAAYKKVYRTELPLWQKEVLNRLYGFHKESKEKIELPRTLDINGTVYRKSIQIKDFGEQITKLAEESSTKPAFKIERGVMITGWDPEKDFVSQINECLGICKPLSKREKMWDEILKEGRTPIYVKREDIHDFLKECQVVGIKWVSGRTPLETMPFMGDGYDGAYFFVMTSLDISKSKRGVKEFRHVMTWWTTASDEEAKNSIKYIRPMRWDLFEKGRLVVKVTPDNYKEFYEKCEAVMGKKPMSMVTGPFTVYHGKSGTFHIRPYDDKFPYTHKIVDWEDVR